jgi:hypothetical protein
VCCRACTGAPGRPFACHRRFVWPATGDAVSGALMSSAIGDARCRALRLPYLRAFRNSFEFRSELRKGDPLAGPRGRRDRFVPSRNRRPNHPMGPFWILRGPGESNVPEIFLRFWNFNLQTGRLNMKTCPQCNAEDPGAKPKPTRCPGKGNGGPSVARSSSSLAILAGTAYCGWTFSAAGQYAAGWFL